MVRAIGLAFVMGVLILGEARGATVDGYFEQATLVAPVPATTDPLLVILAFAFFVTGAMLLRRAWVA